ncbi:MAG: protein kinase [Planctomycetes bacterium]|nr:protein kinase [Planctomycetota bacterium]
MAESDTSTAARLLNRTIGGFELLSVLGEGGMGTVYKARQAGLDRIVALKILSPKIANNQTFITRFQREARASAKLNHPHIVQGIDVGHDKENDVWYFAMEFVDGPSVLSVLEDTGKFPEVRALEVAREVALGLECAYKNGIVHRDIKPDNILMTLQGQAKLADLGLARHVEENVGITAEDRAIGTPLYMSPEQARGEDKDIDGRTDIYSLGATLYHLVTGRPPFEGKTAAVIMTKHITDAPPLAHVNAPGVSSATARLIERMMQKKREDRVQTPSELIKEIDKLRAALKAPPAPPPASRSGRLGKPRTVSVRMPAAPPEDAPPGASSSKRMKAVPAPGESTKAPGKVPESVPVTETKSARASSRKMLAAAPAAKPSTPVAPAPPAKLWPPPVPEKKEESSDATREVETQATTPSKHPGRISLADRRKKEQSDTRKRTLEGVLTDIVVLALVLGVLAAGIIYLRGHGYLKLPSEWSSPAEKSAEPAKSADPAKTEPEAKTDEKTPAAKSGEAKSE